MLNTDDRFIDFINEFKSDVINYQEANGSGYELSFVQCAYEGTDQSEIGVLDSIYIEGKLCNCNVKVEGFRYDDDDQTLVLAVAIFDSFNRKRKLTQTEIKSVANQVRAFFKLVREKKLDKIASDLKIDISSQELDLVRDIQGLDIDRLLILVFTDMELSDRIKQISIDDVNDVSVETQLWDLKRLFEIASQKGQREPIDYSFEAYPIDINLVSNKNEDLKSYIGSISAPLLADLYKRYGARLLEGNVRSFLSVTTSVNKQIRKSLKEAPQDFFIYNNGIAATAKNLKFNSDNQLIQATDFQIINGGQTTASISRAAFVDKFDISKAFVPIKLTEISDSLPEDKIQELVANISKASNNQNKISDSDFFSNHPFHVEMENKSERIIAPQAKGALSGTKWYYERSKGAYKQKKIFADKKQSKEIEAKYPKNQVIKKEDLARVWLCWNVEPQPDVVSKGAAYLFAKFSGLIEKEWSTKDQTGAFGDNYFKETVSLIIMLRDLKKAIQATDWYGGGYLANISTYAIAVLASHCQTELGSLKLFDLLQIWKKQETPDELLHLLLAISKKVCSCITNPTSGNANVTQWCKQKKCWEQVRQAFENETLLDSSCKSFILSKESLAQEEKDNKAEAKQDQSISYQIQACNYKYWKEAEQFSSGQFILVEKYKRAIHAMVLGKFEGLNCKFAIEALAKLRAEGFSK